MMILDAYSALEVLIDDNRIDINSGEVCKQIYGDLGYAFGKLKKFKFQSMFHSSQRKAALGADNEINESKISELEKSITQLGVGGGSSPWRTYEEMFAAIAFDSVY